MHDGGPTSDQNQPDGDERWNVTLDDDFVKAATIVEGARGGSDGDAPQKRDWPRNLALALAAAALTFFVFKVVQPAPDTTDSRAGGTATATASVAGAAAADRPQIPLAQAFPAEVSAGGAVYTKVGTATMGSCTQPDSVGPRLIAMIKEGKGCVGEQIALYKDKQDDHFNLAIFTMKDPKDTVRLVTELTMAFDDFEVGAQAPPPASGLRTLPQDSSMVQAFIGNGRAMVAALGQWSDGRATDLQALEDRVSALQEAIGKNVFAYESHRPA
ncbi:hypothetical protein [Streptacidiphilus fuscans]|uniref:Uncharacterized protein n=1 Tax=Streptacidiphilus fuscans TaxID=2789292 RepID=A0A931BG51_9ACTN|nr:hypothetical protein [Streptacidiphilus fuscans]MBF9072840.1 hypothetical protein [Streptacidiphilus fuscans]